jgi:DNA replication and repair protein RecF
MAELALKSLTLSQFRSHARARLDLDCRPVAIFGSNGAGKTNILEAVSLLSPGRGIRRAAAADMARRGPGIGWKITADLSSLGHAHELETSFVPDGARQVSINGKSATQAALGRVLRMLWLVPAMDRLWIEGADGRRRFLDRATLSFEPAHAEISLTYEKAMRERNRLLKDMVRDAHWYRALESQMADTGLKIQENRRMALSMLQSAQDQASSAFPVSELTLQEGEFSLPESQADYEAALAEHRHRDLAAGRTLMGPHRSDLGAVYSAKGAPALDCSTGEQKALLVSLILANARALASSFGAPPILLLDEIAAHLDSDRRAALYDEICELGAQAWMTGTGAELFAELGDRAQFIEVSETAGVSACQFISAQQIAAR